MERFWELLERSILIQGLVTLAFVVVACIRFAKGETLDEPLKAILMLILGFWFGTYSHKQLERLGEILGKE